MFTVYASTPLSCRRCVGALEASGVVEVVVRRRLDRWRSETSRAALFCALCNLSIVASGAANSSELQ